MGVGKTRVGRELARRLDADFFDTDEIIKKDERRDVAQVIEEYGEAYFRKKEAQVFRKLMAEESAVLHVSILLYIPYVSTLSSLPGILQRP